MIGPTATQFCSCVTFFVSGLTSFWTRCALQIAKRRMLFNDFAYMYCEPDITFRTRSRWMFASHTIQAYLRDRYDSTISGLQKYPDLGMKKIFKIRKTVKIVILSLGDSNLNFLIWIFLSGAQFWMIFRLNVVSYALVGGGSKLWLRHLRWFLCNVPI